RLVGITVDFVISPNRPYFLPRRVQRRHNPAPFLKTVLQRALVAVVHVYDVSSPEQNRRVFIDDRFGYSCGHPLVHTSAVTWAVLVPRVISSTVSGDDDLQRLTLNDGTEAG